VVESKTENGIDSGAVHIFDNQEYVFVRTFTAKMGYDDNGTFYQDEFSVEFDDITQIEFKRSNRQEANESWSL
jgi:hypothetical protein